MKERPIIFNDEMVRAILDGRKTQTRRVVKPQPFIDASGNFCWNDSNFGQDLNGPRIQAIASPIPSSKTKRVHCPYGQPGDRLWVREAFQGPLWDEDNLYPDNGYSPEFCVYRADGGPRPEYIDADENLRFGWRSSASMPRWASRITLEITNVRVERVQDISGEDAIAEGIQSASEYGNDADITDFSQLWNSIYGPDSWAANPWVWVIEFRRAGQ